MKYDLTVRSLIPTYNEATGQGTFQLLTEDRVLFGALFEGTARGAVWRLRAGRWYPQRTTGWKSQNHAINGYCQQIAMSTGQDFGTVKLMVKLRAVDMGYPFETYRTYILPKSEASADTKEASLLIDATHMIAAELNIILKEESN